MNEEGEIFQAYLNIETNETIYKWSGAMGELLDGVKKRIIDFLNRIPNALIIFFKLI